MASSVLQVYRFELNCMLWWTCGLDSSECSWKETDAFDLNADLDQERGVPMVVTSAVTQCKLSNELAMIERYPVYTHELSTSKFGTFAVSATVRFVPAVQSNQISP